MRLAPHLHLYRHRGTSTFFFNIRIITAEEPNHEMDSSDFVERLEQTEAELRLIRQRNQRVEADKAWERSTTRRIALAFATYVVTAVVFYSIGVSAPLQNALIPTTGYLLSTLSLPRVRAWWQRQYQDKQSAS
ncbi:MAG: hypothetical protein KDD69_08510 [Bdellovibrionales bacterium]|nr:hypothetical protein [Bdellovibrionales bacterium]